MTWVGVGATVVGGVIGSKSASKAAKQQQRAADAALAEQSRQFDLGRADQAPYREAGTNALSRLGGLQDVDPTPNALAVQSEPGYQFGLQQGRDALEGSAAARGGLYSGNTMKALTQYGNDYASTKYGDAFNRQQSAFGNRWNRLSGLAGIGQTATQQAAQAGQSYANQAGNIGMGNANAQGANALAQGSIWGNALNQIGAMKFGGGQQQPYTYGQNGETGDFARMDRQGYADGGAVRVPPVVGRNFQRMNAIEKMREIAKREAEESKARAEPRLPNGLARVEAAERKALGYADGGAVPRPRGSMAQASLDVIRRAIDAAQASVQRPVNPPPGTIAALPANPVTNPAAIVRSRMQQAGEYAAGGAVPGADPGRADTVSAQLSGGEHVFDAEIVSMLGDGNTEAGHALLEELKQRVRAAKRATPAAQPAE